MFLVELLLKSKNYQSKNDSRRPISGKRIFFAVFHCDWANNLQIIRLRQQCIRKINGLLLISVLCLIWHDFLSPDIPFYSKPRSLFFDNEEG